MYHSERSQLACVVSLVSNNLYNFQSFTAEREKCTSVIAALGNNYVNYNNGYTEPE